MRPEDPRHGQYRGAVAHWGDKEPLCEPCKLAATRYAKRRKAELHATGQNRRVPSWRVRRRIEALLALGWDTQQIADAAGMTFSAVWNLGLKQPDVYRSGFEKIDAAYRRLCMTRPEGGYATRTRNRAARRGYVPPLGWDDIDDPNEQPAGWEYIAADRAEQLRELVALGYGISAVCSRLGVARHTLEKWSSRAGLGAEFRAAVARETPPRENNNQYTAGAA